MSFDYCKLQISSTHIYINPKRGCPCKERHKHVLLSMNRSKYATKLQLKFNLITPLIDNFQFQLPWNLQEIIVLSFTKCYVTELDRQQPVT